MRIADYVEMAAERHPTREVFVDDNGRIDYPTAAAFMNTVACRIAAHPDLPPGSGIAIYSPNDARVSMLQLGINRADRMWVLIHTRNSVETNAATIAFADTKLVLFHSAFEAAMPTIRAATSPAMKFVCIDRDSDHGPSLETWLAGADKTFPATQEDPLAAAFMVPTGGTTGVPRAVVHTHRSTEISAASLAQAIAIDDNSRHLAVAPLTHAAGFMALCFAAAGGVNIILPGFDLDRVLASIASERITHLYVPPTALYAVLAHPKLKQTDLSSLRCLVIGAAPVAPAKFKEAVAVFGPIVYEGYGQTEALLPLTLKRPGDYLRADGSFDEAILRSAGRPGPFVRVAIMSPEGKLLPPGEPGEIVVQSSMVMKGYHKMPKETEEVSRLGWHHTTDVGFRDAQGFITIVDRIKDVIVSGGFNIYPAEIEAAASELPPVLECSVVGVPDEKWGEAVKAVIQLKPGAALTEAEVIEHCKARLGSMKAPKSVEFWPELPRSVVGKVLKREIRKRYWHDQWRAV